MSTHNIGFYEEINKIIFELSSNIIKYAPYFFSCTTNFFHLAMQLKNNVMYHKIPKFSDARKLCHNLP